jgi:hypothetical protein
VLAGTLLTGSVPLAPLALADSGGQSWSAISPIGGGIWICAVILPMYLAYTWWTAAIAFRGVAAIAPYVLLVPVAGGLFALAWLAERSGS